MAWRAYIQGVSPNPVPTDSIWVEIRFYDPDTERRMDKTFKYVSGTTRADFEAMIKVERDKLRQLDSAMAVLQGAIGEEVV